jgi:hypothetical protein
MTGPVNGTYIYYVELRQKETREIMQRFTLSLVMTKIKID